MTGIVIYVHGIGNINYKIFLNLKESALTTFLIKC